jgi:hypothetical protein
VDKPIGFYCFLAFQRAQTPIFSEDDALRIWRNAADKPTWAEGWRSAAMVAIAMSKNQPQAVPESQAKQPIEIDWLKLNADMSKV